MNPYERYRHVAFTLDEFLKMVKANKEHFINYCEIVVMTTALSSWRVRAIWTVPNGCGRKVLRILSLFGTTDLYPMTRKTS